MQEAWGARRIVAHGTRLQLDAGDLAQTVSHDELIEQIIEFANSGTASSFLLLWNGV
jgi:hypothetical protein